HPRRRSHPRQFPAIQIVRCAGISIQQSSPRRQHRSRADRHHRVPRPHHILQPLHNLRVTPHIFLRSRPSRLHHYLLHIAKQHYHRVIRQLCRQLSNTSQRNPNRSHHRAQRPNIPHIEPHFVL